MAFLAIWAAGIVKYSIESFVIVCKMSGRRCSCKSIISQYLSAFLILRLQKVDYRRPLPKLRFDKRMAGYLIQIGLPAGLKRYFSVQLFIQAGVNTFERAMVWYPVVAKCGCSFV